jgi:redox-sensitive bicupin YhaK (pirin superfamily)
MPEVTVLSSSSSSVVGEGGKENQGTTTKEVKVRIIMGEAHGVKAKIDSWTPMNVLHVSMDAGSTWSFPLPATHNLFLYIKKGPLDVLTSPGAKKAEGNGNGGDVPPRFARINTHETVFFKQGGDFLQVHSPAATGKGGKEEGADFLLLSGEPLREPVTASGPFVLNDAEQVQMAYNRYQMGAFGVPWEHTMNDEEWQELCRRRGVGGGGRE